MNNPEFQVHMLNSTGIQKAISIRNIFDTALDSLIEVCTPPGAMGPYSREFSIAKTKLEEACFFAKKAIANQEDNQLQDEGGKL